MKWHCHSLNFPHRVLLINCPFSSCDGDYFNQGSQDTHSYPVLHWSCFALLPCTTPTGCPSLAIIRRFFFSLTFNPSIHFFFPRHSPSATNNLTSAPLSPCRRGIMSLYGRKILEQKQGGWKQHDMQCAPPCVFTHALVTGWDKAPLSQVNTKAQQSKMARLTLDLLCTYSALLLFDIVSYHQTHPFIQEAPTHVM